MLIIPTSCCRVETEIKFTYEKKKQNNKKYQTPWKIQNESPLSNINIKN